MRRTSLIIAALFSISAFAQTPANPGVPESAGGKLPKAAASATAKAKKKAKEVTEKASAGAIKTEKATAAATPVIPAANAPDETLINNSAVGSSGPQLKFNTGEAPVATDPRDTIKFKGMESFSNSTPSQANDAKPILEASADDDGFKSYIGYPKHELALIDGFDTVSAKWGYNGQNFNFNSATVAYGLAYTFVGTPSWKIGLNFSQYEVSLPAAGPLSGYTFLDSKETMIQYGLNSEYCFISSANFYRQYCLGGLIMNDSYPVLKFGTGPRLLMSKVQDIVVGVHGAVQIPLTDKVYFKPILGYNYGTGAGQSGALTAKANTKFYFRGEVPWLVTRMLTLKLHADYSARQATVEGQNGTNKDKWETDSTVLGGGLDAVLVF